MIERKIAELEQIRDITTRIIMKAIMLYPQIRKDMYIKINDLRIEINSNKNKIMKCKVCSRL